MTQEHPEPNRPEIQIPERAAEPNPAYDTGEEFVPAQDGEQGDGETEPGDDSDNPMAGVDVSELEAPDPVTDPGQDVADDAEQDDDAGADAAERLGAQQDS